MTARRFAELVARVGLGGMFLYAGLIKASDSASFALALVPFTILPEAMIPWMAMALPSLEVLAGVAILVPRTARWGAGLCGALLVVFAGALAWALSEGIIVDCGCFGESGTPSAEKMVLAAIRDLMLAGVAAWVAVGSPSCIRGKARKTEGSG